VPAGLVGGVEEAGQAGEAVEVELNEIVDAIRGEARLAVEPVLIIGPAKRSRHPEMICVMS
jgi:triosephosphate isomerase